jgi:hypothetical protein
VTVKVRVSNSGDRAGAEVVQLYLGFPDGRQLVTGHSGHRVVLVAGVTRRPHSPLWSVVRAGSARSAVAAQLPRRFSASSE